MSLFFKYELIKEPFVENSYGIRRKWRGFPLYEWRQGNNWFTNPQFYELTELEALRWYITVTREVRPNQSLTSEESREHNDQRFDWRNRDDR